MYFTTLQKIRNQIPCCNGWTTLLRHLGKTAVDDEPLSLLTILESNGLEDAVWALRAVEDPACERDARLFAVRCARQVQHHLTDQRSLAALDVAESYAIGEATDEELIAARDDALAARAAAWDAALAAKTAAWDTALAAERTARAAEAAEAATRVATGDAVWVVNWAATRAAVRDAACGAARQDFVDIFCS